MKVVSAIMPTSGHQQWARQALECFARQTYPFKEIIIIDDSNNPSFPEPLSRDMNGAMVHYARIPGGNIPYKRNMCCGRATGDIIAHFDSDDWSAPERLADQVRILVGDIAVTGYHSMLFTDGVKAYRYKSAFKDYTIGTSLTYLRSWWETYRFDQAFAIGEDSQFALHARRAKSVIAVDAGQMMVARIHPGNTSKKDLNGDNYLKVDMTELPRGFVECGPAAQSTF